MLDTFLIILAAGLLLWRIILAIQVGRDAHQRGFAPAEVARWAARAVVAEDRYWWGARLEQLKVFEARELLAEMAQAHDLLLVTNVRCPLCETEIQNALNVASTGELYVRRQSHCTQCDFRLDACRHCQHFLPATGSLLFERNGDFGHGRCGFYRAAESVRTAHPEHAARLESLGFDRLLTPKPIVDSYIPLPECTAFLLKLEYARQNHIPWLNRQRIALIRLQQKFNRPRLNP